MQIIKCTTTDQLIDHYLIRKKVFIDEQKVSYEEEFDLTEKKRIAFVVYLDNVPIGAARINFQKDYAKIERVCILKEYRGQGYGLKLMEYLIDYSKKYNYNTFKLGAQAHAIKFYEKLGFEKYGEEFLDANIPHYNMIKK